MPQIGQCILVQSSWQFPPVPIHHNPVKAGGGGGEVRGRSNEAAPGAIIFGVLRHYWGLSWWRSFRNSGGSMCLTLQAAACQAQTFFTGCEFLVFTQGKSRHGIWYSPAVRGWKWMPGCQLLSCALLDLLWLPLPTQHPTAHPTHYLLVLKGYPPRFPTAMAGLVGSSVSPLPPRKEPRY